MSDITPLDTVVSFANGKNFYKVFWVFFICCFLGNCCEMVFAYAKNGSWICRQGLIWGPFNQIYGLGAVLFMLALYNLRDRNAGIIFVASALSGAAFEWLCSWVQEIAFHSHSWEYSDTPVNIGGRTNLFFAICWGFMGLVFIRNLYPWLSEHIEKIPNSIGRPLTWVLAVFMAVNIIVSIAAVTRWKERTYAPDVPPKAAIGRLLDKYYPNEKMSSIYTSLTFK